MAYHWSVLFDTISGDRTDLGFVEKKMFPHGPGGTMRVTERRMHNERPAWAPNSRYILFCRGSHQCEADYFQFERRLFLVD